MFSYPARKHSPRRYVRPALEELEWRHVPSFLGLQIALPPHGILEHLTLSVGIGTTPTSATMATPTPATTTPGTTTTSPSLVLVSLSFAPTVPGSNPSSAPASGATTGASLQPALASSQSETVIVSAGSSSAFHEGTGQVSGGTLAAPSVEPVAAVSGFGGLASQAVSSTVVGGTVVGITFDLVGNLSPLLGPANVPQGTTSTSLSAAAPTGAPLAGSVFGRPALFTDQGTGVAPAFGLTQPTPADDAEPLPEKPPTPPDEDWVEAVPQAVEETIPPGYVLLRKQADSLPSVLRILPDRPYSVDPRVFDALFAGVPEDITLCAEDVGMPADEEQPGEHSGMTAAVAMLSCGLGAYWSTRFRGRREAAVDLPRSDEEM